MEKLLEALLERHPGHEVVEVRFLLNAPLPTGKRIADYDAELAHAVRNSVEVDLAALSRAASGWPTRH